MGKRKTDDDRILRFSLAGVHLKFSAVKEARGGLTIPVDGVGGSWIVKLPDTRFKGVPENEFAIMELARRMGIALPETALVPVEKIAGLPLGVEQAGPHAFAIKRFDRTENGRAVHIEDFAQIFGVYPHKKYERASYGNIAQVVWAELGEEGLVEFIRRFVFNALIGNGDMHLKNWSLIYPDGRTPALAPAYDFLSTVPYIRDDALALTFVDTKAFHALSSDRISRFAAKAGLPERIVLDTAAETVERLRGAWHSIGNTGIDMGVREVIDAHLKTIPLWEGN